MTADTPIRALLSAIQPQIAPQGGWLRPVNYHGSFLRQAHAGGVLTNGGWHSGAGEGGQFGGLLRI